MLAGLLADEEFRGPLRADFRRFYGTSIDLLRAEGTPLTEVADMAAYLPPESAVHRANNPNWMHNHELELLRRIEFHTNYLVYFKTKDGEKGRNKPGVYLFPWEEAQAREDVISGEVMPIDELDDFLGWSVPV